MKKKNRAALALLLCSVAAPSAIAQNAQQFDMKCTVHEHEALKGNPPIDRTPFNYYQIDMATQQWCETTAFSDVASVPCNQSDTGQTGVWGERLAAMSDDARLRWSSTEDHLEGSMDGDWLLTQVVEPYVPTGDEVEGSPKAGDYSREGVNLRTHKYAEHDLDGDNETIGTGDCKVLPFTGKF